MSDFASISVIIPTYNRCAQLKQAIRGALEQTVPPVEVLVCDDGSTDGSRDVVNAMKEARVRWIEGPHVGRPAGPRNRGLGQAMGRYVAFLDDDDFWLPRKLEVQMEAIAQSGLRACCSNAWRVGTAITGRRRLLDALPPILGFRDMLRVNQVVCSSMLVETKLVTSLGGFPEDEELTALEDYCLWLRVSALSDIRVVDEPLVVYRDDMAGCLRTQGERDGRRQRAKVFRAFLKGGKGPMGRFAYHRKAAAVAFRYFFESLREGAGRFRRRRYQAPSA